MRTTRYLQLLGAALLLATEYGDAGADRRAVQRASISDLRVSPADGDVNNAQLIVDGQKTPELISDALAYKHFLGATSVSTTPSENELTVQRLLLDRVGLSDEDRRRFMGVAKELRQRISESGSPLALEAQRQLVDDARRRLLAELTPEGFRRIDLHVTQYTKRRIKVYSTDH